MSGHLLFTRTTPPDVQTLFVASGDAEQQISDPGQYCCVSRISPDHRRILVMPGTLSPPIAGGTIDPDGGRFQPLVLGDKTLNQVPTAWSPDASRIAFLGWDDQDPNRRGIYTARASDGADLVRVTIRPGLLEDVPLDYSPDGRQLVFYRAAHPDPDPHIGGSLWVVNVDGSGAHQITGPKSPPADWARWSPDGAQIVFGNERLSPSGAIWTVAPDGSRLTKVFTDAQGRFPIGPTWSPDGTRILFALNPNNDAFTHPPNGLYTITAEGRDLTLVIGGEDFKSQPEWWQ